MRPLFMLTRQLSARHVIALVGLSLIAIVDHVNATDRISEPPAREAFLSPGGCYEFVIRMNGEPEEWLSEGSIGVLFRKDGGEAEMQWANDLPHAYRPRFAFVNDDGYVLLLDQWINIAGPYAVTLIDRDGHTVVMYEFYDIADAIGIPGREIIPMAKHGSWMSSEPSIDINNNLVRVAVGGRELLIHFESGKLTVDPGS